MLVATKPSVSTSHVATSLFPSLLFRPAHASRVVWPDWFARAFRVAYTVAIVGYTALSLTGNTSAASSSLFSLIGRGNLWLFGPDPARDYLHVTACWRSITSHDPFCDGTPAFASYTGSLDDALLSTSKPTREFRVVEQLFDLSPDSRRSIDVFARRLMATTSPGTGGRACFRVYVHRAALDRGTPRRFEHQVVWKACR
jgi:hypothetical protein